MLFGICLAPEYFQQKLDENLEGLNEIYKIADDLLMATMTITSEGCLKTVGEGTRRNRAKFSFKWKELPFIGLTSNGLKPDPNKVRAIVDMD